MIATTTAESGVTPAGRAAAITGTAAVQTRPYDVSVPNPVQSITTTGDSTAMSSATAAEQPSTPSVGAVGVVNGARSFVSTSAATAVFATGLLSTALLDELAAGVDATVAASTTAVTGVGAAGAGVAPDEAGARFRFSVFKSKATDLDSNRLLEVDAEEDVEDVLSGPLHGASVGTMTLSGTARVMVAHGTSGEGSAGCSVAGAATHTRFR
jgi:hypothetical protein